MHKQFTILIFLVCFLACQKNLPKKQFPITEMGDNMIHITMINSAGDTLFQVRNTTKGAVIVYYHGDSIFLLTDGLSFSNETYMLTEQNDTTRLLENGQIIFQNPAGY